MDVPPDLVLAAQRGDKEALEDLITRSYRPAYTLALRLMVNPDDAAEATQEAYAKMVRSLKGFREPGAFATWLFRIVSNVCLTQMRKRSRYAGMSDVNDETREIPDLRAVDPEDAAITSLFRTEVEECMRRLPDAYRAVVVLRDVQGLPGIEVAAILGISPGAVKVRLHRAHRKMRDDLLGRFPDWHGDDSGSGKKASA